MCANSHYTCAAHEDQLMCSSEHFTEYLCMYICYSAVYCNLILFQWIHPPMSKASKMNFRQLAVS